MITEAEVLNHSLYRANKVASFGEASIRRYERRMKKIRVKAQREFNDWVLDGVQLEGDLWSVKA